MACDEIFRADKKEGEDQKKSRELYKNLKLDLSFEALRLLFLIEAHLYFHFELEEALESYIPDVVKYEEGILVKKNDDSSDYSSSSSSPHFKKPKKKV